MKMLTVLLNVGTGLSVPLSTTLFWVGIALLVGLFFFFYFRTIKILDKKEKEEMPAKAFVGADNTNLDLQGETAAAIALAMHMYKTELHDKESFTLTLKKVSRIYSPWSSKIYTLRQNPR